MTWRRFVAVCGGVAVVAALLPHGPVPLVLESLVGAAATAAIVAGLRRYRPSRPGAWRLFGIAVATWVVGDLVYFGWDSEQGTDLSPAAAVLYVVAYCAMLGGLALLVRSRGPVRQVEGRLDAGVITTAMLAVSWAAVIAPSVAAADDSASGTVPATVLATVLAIGYPLADVLLAGMAVRLIAMCRGHAGARLLLASVLLMAVADAGLQAARAVDGAMPRVLQLGWVLGYVLLGAAALHPRMRELSDVDLAPDGIPAPRLVALWLGATLVLPAVALVQVARGEAPWASIVLSPVVVLLAGARMGLLVTRLARQAAELVDLVDTDHGTGLPNANRLGADLDALLATPGRAGLLLLGVDHVSELTELLGRSRREEVLRETGRRLREALGPAAVLARAGEGTFAVIDQSAAAPAPALILAQRLRSVAERPHALDDGPLALDVAVGVAMLPRDATTSEQAMRRAEAALAEARERPDHVAVFSAQMAERLPSASALREIRLALDRREIVLHYQPQLDLESGRVLGVEALARWVHPTRGLVPPGDFLALVERGDLVDRFTAHVLDLALDQAVVWRDAGRPLRVAVNLSARNLLDPLLPTAVSLGLTNRGLPATAVELEITETSAMEHPERSRVVLDELAELGVAVAVDDYGTGYSALAYLRQLSVKRLKIDRSFVAALVTDAASRSIVVSTLDLARDLGLDVVAEGVEDDETLLRLRDLGCPYAQGFGIGRPVPAEDVLDLVGRIEERMRTFVVQPSPAVRALELLPRDTPPTRV